MADPTSNKYYAWSKFIVERNEHGQTKKAILPGEEVSAEILGVSKEQFAEFVQAGSARKRRYPDIPENSTMSPVEYYREQARLAGEEALSSVENEAAANAVAATQVAQ